ncbi:MAG TPA: MarR family transcriptional regulator [Solirubrobacteraceae bacterium]|jgi:DNA-binding MarR family transcriptional regulator
MQSSLPDDNTPGDGVLDAAIAASRALVGLAARSLAGLDQDVTLPQYRMLVVLGTRGPRPASLLAAALGVAAPTATRMCDRLVRKGLIERRPDAHDRRQVLLSLTAEGRRLLDAVTKRRRQEIAALLSELPADKHAALVEAFQLFADAAGELADADWAAGWDLES